MNQSILVVEDEPKISSLLREYLENSGFQVSLLDNGALVIGFVKKHHPTLILLDVMLPGMDGLEICRELRKFTEVPVIMLTAKSEEIDRLIGLELGADDYICKPFSPREVVARVKTVLRRMQPVKVQHVLQAGPLLIDRETRSVTVNEKEIELTPSEFGLLTAFMEQPKRVFSRNELINKVLGLEFEGYDRAIDTHIKNLRKKLAPHLAGQEVISSVYGVGYKFVLTAAS